MNRLQEADVIHVCGENEDFLWLSEKAENRLSWILAGILVLAIALPLGALAFLM